MKKIDLIENQEYDLNENELEEIVGGNGPFISGELKPFKTNRTLKNNICPKCGATIQTAVCKFVEGRGLEMIVSCWEDDLHWISQTYKENEEVPYIFVKGEFVGGGSFKITNKSF